MKRISLMAMAVLLAQVPAQAGTRVGFYSTPENEFEICLFRAGGSEEHPDVFLSAGEVACFPGEQVVDLPSGNWFYYGQSKELASFPSSMLKNRPHPTRDLYSATPVTLRPAATLNVSAARSMLRPNERLLLYVSNDGSPELPMVVPIPDDREQLKVPVATEVRLIVERLGSIAAVSPAYRLRAGEVTVSSLDRGRRQLLGWVAMERSAKTAEIAWARLEAPTLSLRSSKAEVRSIRLPGGEGSDGTLFVFEPVHLGPAEIKLGGREWRSETRSVDIREGLNYLARPLSAAPDAQLEVRWLTTAASPRCQASAAAGEGSAVSVWRCETEIVDIDPEQLEMSACTFMAESEAPDDAEYHKFDSLLPGRYVLSIRSGSVKRRHWVDLSPGINVEDYVQDAFRVTGSVTRDDEPVDARVVFGTGEVETDYAGDFRGNLLGDPGTRPIQVRDCGSDRLLYVEVPEQPLRSGSHYRISLPDNTVELRVKGRGGAAIDGAHVSVWAVDRSSGDTGIDFQPAGDLVTDQQGVALLRNLPPERSVRLCASAPSYQRSCTSVFSLAAKGTPHERIDLSLVEEDLHGRVIVPWLLERSTLFLVGGDGRAQQRLPLASDGRFTFAPSSEPAAYAVLVGAGPLAVLPVPFPLPDPLTLAPLNGMRERSIEVIVREDGTSQSFMLALMIDGYLIPRVPFMIHQELRSLDTEVTSGNSLIVPSLLSTGRVEVIQGPSVEQMLSGEIPNEVDPFIDAAHAGRYPRRLVGADNKVHF